LGLEINSEIKEKLSHHHCIFYFSFYFSVFVFSFYSLDQDLKIWAH